jgi:hypothetical protein
LSGMQARNRAVAVVPRRTTCVSQATYGLLLARFTIGHGVLLSNAICGPVSGW